jgi:virginiamycin B lyase
MSTSSSQLGRNALKTTAEYPLPADEQTHEIVAPFDGLLLISQQPGSALVKMGVDPSTGRPIAAAKHTIDDPFAGLHGLSVSKRHQGFVWATLQFTSELVLIDPRGTDPDEPPQILRRVTLPAPAKGPHVVIEDGDDLWTSCKDSHHVVRINPDRASDCSIFPCEPRPIFVAVHPESRDVYATLDQSSAIFRVVRSEPDDSPDKTKTIPIPAEMGSTPVGMIPGPEGNVWFVLLGGSAGGQGRFGRITDKGEIQWFHINHGAAMGAALIHLGFDPGAQAPGAPTRIFLLGSSMASTLALNAVFDIGMSAKYDRIETQQTIAFPSQNSMSHRVLPTRQGLYATELGACAVVHLAPAYSPYGEGINEMSDPYALRGCGVPKRRVDY